MTHALDHREAFRRLHESRCFVMPNPWDLGSARALVRLGFPTVATTSCGFAWTLGRPDNAISLEEALAHFRSVSRGVTVPVHADFEGGFAVAPRPVNVLVGGDFTTVEELAALGVRRISVGGALARAAWTGFLAAAREIAERGTFAGLRRALPYAEVNDGFAAG